MFRQLVKAKEGKQSGKSQSVEGERSGGSQSVGDDGETIADG